MIDSGVEMIRKERERVIKEGKTISYDCRENDSEELVDGAVALLTLDYDAFPEKWSEETKNKMYGATYKKRILYAAQLLAAELDRVQSIDVANFIRCPNG